MSHRDDPHGHGLGSDHAWDARQNPPAAEQQRVAWALARADRHSVRELYFLDLAVKTPDEDRANAFEVFAYEAYKDALAIKEEHDLDT